MNTQSLHKAAVLIRSLDAESAAALIARLSDDEARTLRQAIRDLGDVHDDQREMLLEELRGEPTRREAVDAGVELAFSSASDVAWNASIEPQSVAPPPERPPSPFAWLDQGDLPTLAERLAREQVSTVALVLSLLPAERAGGLLAALPAELQTESLARLAELGDVDPASLELVEADLEAWLRDHKACQRRRQDRQTTIAAILQNSPDSTRRRVVSSLQRVGAEWAPPLQTVANNQPQVTRVAPSRNGKLHRRPGHQVDALRARVTSPASSKSTSESPSRQPLPPFGSLTSLTATAFGEVLRTVGPATAVLAFAGADGALHDQLRRWLPANYCRELERRIHSLQGISLRDIDTAQQTVVRTAHDMATSGRIEWPAATTSQPTSAVAAARS